MLEFSLPETVKVLNESVLINGGRGRWVGKDGTFYVFLPRSEPPTLELFSHDEDVWDTARSYFGELLLYRPSDEAERSLFEAVLKGAYRVTTAMYVRYSLTLLSDWEDKRGDGTVFKKNGLEIYIPPPLLPVIEEALLYRRSVLSLKTFRRTYLVRQGEDLLHMGSFREAVERFLCRF